MSTVVLFEEITETVKVPQYAASSSNTPAECLADVLGQCPELVKLELQGNNIQSRGPHGLAGDLAQCTALAHLNFCGNWIGTVGEGRLRASWRGQASGLVL